MFFVNPNGESGDSGSTGIGGVSDPRIVANQCNTLGARLLSAGGAERFIF